VYHVIRAHEENKGHYAGPRRFIRNRGLESHTLDTNDRRQPLGIGLFNITKCSTEVCLEHAKLTDNAIIPLKERVVDASYDPVASLGRKILRRTALRLMTNLDPQIRDERVGQLRSLSGMVGHLYGLSPSPPGHP
jgi:succinate dehydrogenase / fumarate reductase iron-sulfur subunit